MRPLTPGDRIRTDYGPATVVGATSRSVTYQITEGPEAGTTLNTVTGTPGYDRLAATRTPSQEGAPTA